jgi:hypothetical protein
MVYLQCGHDVDETGKIRPPSEQVKYILAPSQQDSVTLLRSSLSPIRFFKVNPLILITPDDSLWQMG